MAYRRKGRAKFSLGQSKNQLDKPKVVVTESDIQSACIDLLLHNRFLVIRFNSGTARYGGPGRARFVRFYTICNNDTSSGIQDIWFMKNNEVWFCEVKRPGEKQRESQRKFVGLLEAFGMTNSMVCESWEQLYEELKKISSREKPKLRKGGVSQETVTPVKRRSAGIKRRKTPGI